MPTKQKIVEVSREEFIKALEEARKKLGSLLKLSFALQVDKRRISCWLRGEGPANTTIEELYKRVKAL